jgi:hypothetical protein
MHHIPDSRRIEILDQAIVKVLRAKTPAERVAMGLDCNRTARLLIEGHLQSRYGHWTVDQISAEIARRMCRESS